MTDKEATEYLKGQIKCLKCETGIDCEKCRPNWSSENDIEALEKGIEALETQKTGHWIPVTDRLPNFNDIVLASTDSDYDELRVILTVYNAEEFWFNGKIKAWMPLPKPYNEESEVEENG